MSSTVPIIICKDYPTRWDGVREVEVRSLGKEPERKDVKGANASSETRMHEYLHGPGGWDASLNINIKHVGLEGKNKGRIVRRIFKPAKNPVVPAPHEVYSA